MKLVRLVLLTLEPMPTDAGLPHLTYGNATVCSMPTNPPPGSPPSLLLAATVPLREQPQLDVARMIVVPQEERRDAEKALRVLANCLAAAHQAKRTLSAPMPYIAFEPESEDERAWLGGTAGIKTTESVSFGSTLRIPLTEDTLVALKDRLVGLEFLAEALGQANSSGRFRECVRMFESAFGEWKMKNLKEPLATFLTGNGQGFALDEIAGWLDDKRHGTTHAHGSRSGIALESDFAPIIGRVEQAAFDVLLNKVEWGTTSVARRNIWRPLAGALGTAGELFIVQGVDTNIEMTFTDEGGFPIHLQGFLTLPEKWWSKRSRELRFSGKTQILPA